MDFTTALASWRRAKETADQAEADWLLARLGGCGDEELDALRQVARERWTFALEMLATAQGIIEIRLLRLGCLPGDGLIEQRGPSDVGLAIEPEVIRRLDHVGRAGPDAEPGV
ncbi:MAG: hypothetical protein EOP39_02900 [Rubrivivax sp.]|nr:MAG: hypothetical protein EOP39_02900 [Rubrivivax sp.]